MQRFANTRIFSVLAAITCIILFTAPARGVQIPLDGVQQVTSDGKKASTDKIAFVDIEILFNEHPLKKRLQEEFLAEANKRKKAIADQEKAIQDLQRVIASSTTQVNQARAELNAVQPAPAAPAAPAAPGGAPAPAPAQGTPQRMLLPGTTEAVMVNPARSSAPSFGAAPVAQSSAPAVSSEASAARQKDVQDKEAGIENMKKQLQKMQDDLVVRVKQDKADLTALEEKQSAQVMADLYKLLDSVAREQTLTIILNKNDVLYGQPYQDITPEVLKRLQGR